MGDNGSQSRKEHRPLTVVTSGLELVVLALRERWPETVFQLHDQEEGRVWGAWNSNYFRPESSMDAQSSKERYSEKQDIFIVSSTSTQDTC